MHICTDCTMVRTNVPYRLHLQITLEKLCNYREQKKKGWTKNLALAFQAYYEYCGCPNGLSYQRRGTLSELPITLGEGPKISPQNMVCMSVSMNFISFDNNLFDD